MTASPRRAQRIGYLVGALLGLAALVLPWLPGLQSLNTTGPPNIGHGNLACQDCHLPASQNKNKNPLETTYPFGYLTVSTKQCQSCHKRPGDLHNVDHYRKKPRFAKARARIAPHKCNSCHKQHSGKRVTIAPSFCSHCHQTFKLEHDPIKPSHKTLAHKNQWNTCLGCHDYHGNHVRRTPKQHDKALPLSRVLSYFQSGPSPYSKEKIRKPKKPKRKSGK